MKARAFLDLADDLAVGDGEAEWRTAISRAYYATFHAARDVLTACGFAVPLSERAHTYLEYRLVNCGDNQLSQTGRQLNNLRVIRNKADYDIDQELDQSTAAHWVYRAADIVLVLESYLADPTRFPALVAAIQTYERDVLREITYRGPAP
jgi:uncharacterized protein (UPF0332 family)